MVLHYMQPNPLPPPRACWPTPYLASSARAMIPAARGAEAEVPVCDSVHFCRKSVVTWGRGRELSTYTSCQAPSKAYPQSLQNSQSASRSGCRCYR